MNLIKASNEAACSTPKSANKIWDQKQAENFIDSQIAEEPVQK